MFFNMLYFARTHEKKKERKKEQYVVIGVRHTQMLAIERPLEQYCLQTGFSLPFLLSHLYKFCLPTKLP